MTPWDSFFREAMKKVSACKLIIDIGGGLRITKERGNVYDERRAYLRDWLKDADYKILDPLPTFKPDIVGDIHNLPFAEGSVDAFICLAVLEHVENPWLAISEMRRSLKPGGYCFAYLPFLFAYHAEPTYYRDYYRFSRDGVLHLFKDFSECHLQEVRGPLETIAHLLPRHAGKIAKYPSRWLDAALGKLHSNQTSGFYVLVRK